MRRTVPLLLAFACQEYGIASRPGPVYGDQPDELAPREVVDLFEQRPAARSDVLFTVDNSGSIDSTEWQRLSDNFDRFAAALVDADVDFHVGLVAGSEPSGAAVPDGRLLGYHPWIDASTDDPQRAFADALDEAGEDDFGSTCESGMVASYHAISGSSAQANEGFYREDAQLTVVMVSDEDDHGWEQGCGDLAGSPAWWGAWALGLKGGDAAKVNVGVIASFDVADDRTPFDCDAQGSPQIDDAGQVYAALLAHVPGVSRSFCQQDWGPVLDQLGLLAAGLIRRFPLTRLPLLDALDQDGDGDRTEPALTVELDRQDGAGFVDVQPVWATSPDPRNPWTWSATGNAIVFDVDRLPEPGWALRVTYRDRAER